MELGEFVKSKRKELGYTRDQLADLVKITSTEIYRIETGARKKPSLKVLTGLASALKVSVDELAQNSDFAKEGERSLTEMAFPGLVTEKQQQTVETIAASLSRNSDLKDEDLDDLVKQVQMFVYYAKKKNDSK